MLIVMEVQGRAETASINIIIGPGKEEDRINFIGDLNDGDGDGAYGDDGDMGDMMWQEDP